MSAREAGPRGASSIMAAAWLLAWISGAAAARAGEGTPPEPVSLDIDFAAIAEATELERAGDVDGAIARLTAAAAAAPEDATVLASRGAVRLRAGDVAGARADFEAAIAANVDDPSGHAGLCVLDAAASGTLLVQERCRTARNRNIADPVYPRIATVAVLMEAGVFDAAAESLDALSVQYAFVPAVRLLSLQVNLQTERWDRARQDLELLRQVYRPAGGAPPRIIDRLAAFKIADLVGADMDCVLDAAAVDIDGGLGGRPTPRGLARRAACRPDEAGDGTARVVAAYNADAVAARAAGDVERAVELLGEALLLAPDDTTLLTNLSHAAFEAGRLDLAETTLRHLLELRPDDAEARRHLGITLLAQGREDEAAPYLAPDAGSSGPR